MGLLTKGLLWTMILIIPSWGGKNPQERIKLSSPDNTYTFNLEATDNLSYSVGWKDKIVIGPSALGFILKDGTNLHEGTSIKCVSIKNKAQ